MARDFSDLTTFFAQDSIDPEWSELNGAIEIVQEVCRKYSMNIIINGWGFCAFPDEDTDAFTQEEILYAIDCITDYCLDADCLIMFTKYFPYISTHIDEFPNWTSLG